MMLKNTNPVSITRQWRRKHTLAGGVALTSVVGMGS